MAVNRSEVAKIFAPGGAVFREVERIAARVHTAVSVTNPVDTGRSRSGWSTRYSTSGLNIEFEVYNNVEYVGYISRRGSSEIGGAFICEAASAVFRSEGVPFTCTIRS